MCSPFPETATAADAPSTTSAAPRPALDSHWQQTSHWTPAAAAALCGHCRHLWAPAGSCAGQRRPRRLRGRDSTSGRRVLLQRRRQRMPAEAQCAVAVSAPCQSLNHATCRHRINDCQLEVACRRLARELQWREEKQRNQAYRMRRDLVATEHDGWCRDSRLFSG